MLDKKLILFIILLLGLLFCSFLGGSRCMKEGFKNDTSTSDIAIRPQGNVYKKTDVSATSTTTNSLTPPNTQTLDTITNASFYGPNGGDARVVDVNDERLF